MTELLRQAFDKAAKLSEAEQDSLGRWLLDELASESQWDSLFARSGDRLRELANEAREEHRRGLTQPLDTEGS